LSKKKSLYTQRRTIHWNRLTGIKSISSLLVATSLGAGLFPVAPGTMGALFGIPLVYWTLDWSHTAKLLFWLGITAVGTWAAAVFDQVMGTQDNQNIVIDEVIGMGITAWTVTADYRSWIVAFFLFRFFDIVKLPPVRQIDQWSKKRSHPYWGGFGVIADDIVAGIQGLIIILVLQYMAILPS
jgi:phosphatidylglycerophosphatase A